jgi:hypothetical protein
MAQSARSLMRSGLISPKASAKLAVLRGTRAQGSKMAAFEHKFKDQGRVQGNDGHGDHTVGHIDKKQHGRGPVGRGQEMPSRSRAGRSETGGAEHRGGSYAPGRNQIDQFPQGQRKKQVDRPSTFRGSPKGEGAFPKGTNVSGSGSTPVAPRSRGGTVRTSGYYGSPNSRTP